MRNTVKIYFEVNPIILQTKILYSNSYGMNTIPEFENIIKSVEWENLSEDIMGKQIIVRGVGEVTYERAIELAKAFGQK